MLPFQLIERNGMHGLKNNSEENIVNINDKAFICQESANKLHKQVRELRTRKDTPVNCLKDMLVHGRVIFTITLLGG